MKSRDRRTHLNLSFSTRKRETEVIAGRSELLCGARVALDKGTLGERETVRPILTNTLIVQELELALLRVANDCAKKQRYSNEVTT